jgi:hypothetical protein
MPKPVVIIGTDGSLSRSFELESKVAFDSTGQNTGNLAFQYATSRLFDEQKFVVPFEFDADFVRNNASLICIPAANFLYNGFNLGALADRIEKTKLPVLTLGLGTQASRSIAEVKLQSGTERLLKVLAERTSCLAIRGSYTAGVLDAYKVKNYEILGCPSNFINSSPTLGKDIADQFTKPFKRMAFAPTFYRHNTELEERVYRRYSKNIINVVTQEHINAIRLARGERSREILEWAAEQSGFLSILQNDDRQDVIDKLIVFFSIEAWLERYRSFDAIIGSRIHGVSLGWQAGRPALLMAHDLRTEELARTMSIPVVKSDNVEANGSLDALMADAHECALEYDSIRSDLAERMCNLLRGHGLTPSESLIGLTRSSQVPHSAQNERTVWGFLEIYNRHRIAGWVGTNQDMPPELLVKMQGIQIAKVMPTKLRPDLKENHWGFELNLTSNTVLPEVAQIEVIDAQSGRQLSNSPVVTNLSADGAHKIFVGSDNWLFQKNDGDQLIDQITAERRLSDHELEAWRSFFKKADKIAKRLNLEMRCLIAPAKECVMAQHLPGEIKVSRDRPVYQLLKLVNSMQLSRLKLVYPLDALAAEQNSYTKGASYWTDVGAAVALNELALSDFCGIEDQEISSADYTVKYRDCDLLAKLGGICVGPTPVRERTSQYKIAWDNKIVNSGRQRLFRSDSANIGGRLLFLHDGFGEWLIPGLANHFEETLAIWDFNLETREVEDFAATAILLERAERSLIVPPGMEDANATGSA